MIPTGNTIAGWVFLSIGVFLVLLAVTLFWIHFETRRNNSNTGGCLISGGVILFLAIPSVVFPLIGFGLVGWNSDYLYYHHVSGTVTQIASRQISDGKAMSTRYVAVLDDGQPYGIDDTRAALLKTGDKVSLMCTREFQWGSTDNGWGCNWG